MVDTALTIIVSGIVLGSLYAAMATGLSLIWSTLGIFNFAHGVFMTLGAYLAWQIGTAEGFGLGATIGLVASVVLMIGVGSLAEMLLVRPLLGRANVLLLVAITTLAASNLVENSILLTWGPRLKQLPPIIDDVFTLGPVKLSAHEAVVITLSPLLLFALWVFLKVSRVGAAIRAVSQNTEVALLIGLNVRALYSLAFGLSAGLAAFAGVLLGSIRFIVPGMGTEPLVKALIVVIFGGIGSLAGTIGGAYVIGLIEATSTALIGLYWTPVLLFVLMIIILVARPTGLFGKQ
jgi:branched-chain amino acid transport system permease protein